MFSCCSYLNSSHSFLQQPMFYICRYNSFASNWLGSTIYYSLRFTTVLAQSSTIYQPLPSRVFLRFHLQYRSHCHQPFVLASAICMLYPITLKFSIEYSLTNGNQRMLRTRITIPLICGFRCRQVIWGFKAKLVVIWYWRETNNRPGYILS